MSDERWAGIVGVLVYLAFRLVDYVLPKGRHWTFLDRFSRRDIPAPEDEEG